jgi:predicted negative regulator of RcsB-dependent stress response
VTCVLVTASAGCVYYNALYNAELAFRRGEEARLRGAADTATAAYRQAAEGATRAWAREPEGEWAARALLLAAHAAVRSGEVAEARRYLSALDELPGERVPESLAGRAEVVRGAVDVVELRLDAALDRLGRLRLDPLDREWLAESWVWRGRAFARLGRIDEAWAAFDFAISEEGGLRLPLAAERAPIALDAGRPNETAAALEVLLATRAGAPWIDTVLAVARRAEHRMGPGLAAEFLEPARSDAWPAGPRDRVLLAQVQLLLAAGDTAAADETLAWLAEGSTEGAVNARLARARLHLARALEFAELVAIRRMLLPIGGDEAARALLLDIAETELLALWGTEGDVPAWFAAGEVARDELRSPGLAGALFLTAAEAGFEGPWVAKSLLAASTVLGERELRERLRRRALRQQLDPYVDRLTPGYLASDDLVRREAELAERVRMLRVRAAAEALRISVLQPGSPDR